MSAHKGYDLQGLSISDARNPIQTYSQLGGPGRVCNKALAIPVHVGLPWRSVEYVMIPAGHNGVGEHTQTTDEIYYIITGTGEMVTNGEPSTVRDGTLVIAPAGTRHSITNASTSDPLSFLVVEVQAENPEQPRSAHALNLLEGLRESQAYPHRVIRGIDPVAPVVSTVNLHDYFAGSWGTFSLVRIPPGSRVEPYTEEAYDQLLFVVHGYASIFVAKNEDEEIPIALCNDEHQSVLIPRGVPRRFTNRASGALYPLLIACLNVRHHSALVGNRDSDQHLLLPLPATQRGGRP